MNELDLYMSKMPSKEDYDAAVRALKPIVRYSESCYPLEVGKSACVLPIDHPSELVSNGMYATTSKVVAIYGDDSFDTKNTRYVFEPAVVQ